LSKAEIERAFVDFVAKETDGLTSRFISPGIVQNEDLVLLMVVANPGQLA